MERRVSSVAVKLGSKLLMGKRRDNEKWTMPGGHADEGEEFHDAAVRELREETGIELEKHQLEPLTGVNQVAPDLKVQGWVANLSEAPSTSMREDPDCEVYRWRWVDVSDGLPEEIHGALHVPLDRNCVLQALDLKPSKENSVFKNIFKRLLGIKKDQPGGSDVHVSAPLGGGKSPLPRGMKLPHVIEKDSAGLTVDLGAGKDREDGAIGIDLYPWDAATIVHDLRLGIPLADGSVSRIMMSGPMDLDHNGLMGEIHRVLEPGGVFEYTGLDGEEITEPSGMVTHYVDKCGVAKDIENDPSPFVQQHFTKLVYPDPATANDAEPAQLATSALTRLQADEGNQAMGYASQVGKNSEPTVTVFKADAMKQIVYGVILEPDTVDAQDDVMTAPDIEETAHKYLVDSRTIGKNHDKPIQAVPVESYIAPADFVIDGEYGKQLVKKGSWVMAVKILDPAEWEKVQSGEYTGFSVGGLGLRRKTD